MIKIFRRHLKKCRHRSRHERRCACPLHAEGRLDGVLVRQSLQTANWQEAERIVQAWETGEIAEESAPVTVAEAISIFMEDCEARKLSQGTIGKYHNLLEVKLAAFAFNHGITHLISFSPVDCRKFRATWNDSAISASKNLERLKAFFRFCVDNHWISENPAAILKPPKVRLIPTLPFSDQEFRKILLCTQRVDEYHYHGKGKSNALLFSFVLLLRYSGLRIGDALNVGPDRLKGGNLLLYTQKSGLPVRLPLPRILLDSFDSFPHCSKKFFYWSGDGLLKTRVSNMQRSLRRVFELAKINKGHAHRFRDTFAVDLLRRGVSLETVSVLLGHASIRVTERHYAPWVKSRQDALDRAVKLAWEDIDGDIPVPPHFQGSSKIDISEPSALSTKRVH